MTDAEAWELIDRHLTALEGDEWHAGVDPVFNEFDEGSLEGVSYWEVGPRRFFVEEVVVELAFRGRHRWRSRAIGAHGVLHEQIYDAPPELN